MEFDVMMLPAVNATLNGIATVLLLVGFYFIRQRKIEQHRKMMISAFSVSVLFLVSYLLYHGLRGGMSTPFGGEGAIRIVYYGILITHVILAAIVPFLAIITLRLGLKVNYVKHRKIARWTWPIWLYVSITGVLVYFMLYQWYPSVNTL